jgi:Leucine-rich repeat (LRR) protein
MRILNFVACCIACLLPTATSVAQDVSLPENAVVKRNKNGSVIDVRLVAKSTNERLTITPETINTLAKLEDLESLSLWGTNVTDDDLVPLASLKKLRVIDLSFTNITGTSLKTLSTLTNLVSVRLDSCDVTDKHLETLESMPQVAMLYLRNTKITDTGLKNLRFLDQILLLDLSDCKITDAGLKSLGDLPVIQHLWLSKTIRYGDDDRSNLTDNSVGYLSTLKTLLELEIADSQITETAMEKLRHALPNTRVNTTRSGITYLDPNK